MIRFVLILIVFFASVEYALASFVPKAFVGDFKEISKGSKGNIEIPLKIKYLSRGNIYYESFDNDGNQQLLYICNSKKTYKYTPPFIEGEKGELAVGDSNKFCFSKIFDALKFGLRENKLYSVEKKKKSAILSFNSDIRKQLGLLKIVLSFKTDKKSQLQDVDQMEIHLKQRAAATVIKFNKLQVVESLDKKIFEFNPPKNTNKTEL